MKKGKRNKKATYVCVFVELQPGVKLKLKEPELRFQAESNELAFEYVVHEVLRESGGFERVKTLEVYRILEDGRRKRLDRWEAEKGWVAPSTPRKLFERPHSSTRWRKEDSAT